METLNTLGQRIQQLIEIIKDLKKEKNKLLKANAELTKQLDALETAMLKGSKNVEELSQEKLATKTLVEDLIKSIDSLISREEAS